MAVPAGLTAAAGLLLVARVAGASGESQGLTPGAAVRGARLGVIAGIPTGALIALGAYLPQTRQLFRDERIVASDGHEAAYELLVRIPLATALSEEILFRSALEGVLSRRRSSAQAAAISALLFGAWHILPTIDRVRNNPRAAGSSRADSMRTTGVVVAAVVATAVASVGLSWLQRRSGSVVAPFLVHLAVNSGGFLGGWLAGREGEVTARTSAADHESITKS